jgi:hypothetical protein
VVTIAAAVILSTHKPKPAPAAGAAASVQAFAAPVEYQLASTVPAANIRGAPSKDAPVVGALSAAEPIDAVGESQDADGKPWLALSLDGGRVGYVRESLMVSLAAPPGNGAAAAGQAAP